MAELFSWDIIFIQTHTTDTQTTVPWTLVSDSFSQNESSETISSSKTIKSIYCQKQDLSFQAKIKFRNLVFTTVHLTVSQHLKTYDGTVR